MMSPIQLISFYFINGIWPSAGLKVAGQLVSLCPLWLIMIMLIDGVWSDLMKYKNHDFENSSLLTSSSFLLSSHSFFHYNFFPLTLFFYLILPVIFYVNVQLIMEAISA